MKNHKTSFVLSIIRVVIATIVILSLSMSNAQAWVGMSTPWLSVNGSHIQDSNGHNLLLHGYMQSGDSWYNGEGYNYADPTDFTSTSNCAGALNFYNAAADLFADTSPRYNSNHGWDMSYVRIITYPAGWDSNGNLSNQNQFNGFINNILIPYADHCAQDGLYLIICGDPTEVFPNGDSTKNMTYQYQQNLITYWTALANSGLKYRSNVLFEICNEPITIESSFGAGDWGSGNSTYWSALTSFMQPIYNAIRNQGANNIVLAPSLGFQSENQGWASYPLSGYNIAYSAHLYPAYGNVHNDSTAVQNLWNYNYKPCADKYPMVITEMYWYQNDGSGYNNLFNGSTSGFGNAVKSAIDNQGNVWYIIGMVGELLSNLNSGLASSTLNSEDGAQAAFSWLYQYTWAGVPGPVASGTYKIVNRYSGLLLDAQGQGTANGTPLDQWSYNGLSNQQWTLTDTGGGIYKIIGYQSGRCVDISNWSTANGARAQLYDYWGNPNQLYTLSATDSGYYRIRPLHATGSALDADSSSGNVQIWAWSWGYNQQWSFASGGDPPFVSKATVGTLRNNFTGSVGFAFTTNTTPIRVSQLGRWVVSGNSQTHTVKIVNASSGAVVASATVSTSGKTAGQFAYTNISPVTLANNTKYYLLSSETSGGDKWYDQNTTITTTSVATVNSSEYYDSSYHQGKSGGYSYGPVSFYYY